MLSLTEVNVPAGVTLRKTFDTHELRFINLSRSLVPFGFAAMIGSWILLFCLGIPTAFAFGPTIRDLLLTLIVGLWIGSWGLPVVAWAAGEFLAARTVAILELGAHQVTGTSVGGGPLPRWTVHDLVEAWASSDHFSPIVAVQTRNGQVDALRVENNEVARWLAGALEEWRQTHGTQPDEQASELLRAMASRVGQAG